MPSYVCYDKHGSASIQSAPVSRPPPPAPLTRYRIFKHAPYWYDKPLPPLPRHEGAVELDSTKVLLPPQNHIADRVSTVYEMEGSPVLRGAEDLGRRPSASSASSTSSSDSEIDFSLVEGISKLHEDITKSALQPMDFLLPRPLQTGTPSAIVPAIPLSTPAHPEALTTMEARAVRPSWSGYLSWAAQACRSSAFELDWDSAIGEIEELSKSPICEATLREPFRGSAYFGYGHAWRFA